jgi:hypothetical protein
VFTERLSFWSGMAVAAAVGVVNPGGARAADPAPATPSQPSQQELLNRINSLQSEVDQLKEIAKAQQKQEDQTARRTEHTTSAELTHDAEQTDRFGLPKIGGLNATYSDGRLVIRTDDNRFSLHPWIQSQFRYEATYRDDAQHSGKDPDTQAGFEIRRLKFGLDGYIFTPDLQYYFQWQVDRKSGDTLLEAAYGKYHLAGTPFYLKAGQFKEPLDHEQILASRYLTAQDRTLSNDLFSGGEGFVQGAGFGFDNGDNIRGELDYTDGARSLNTNFEQFPVGANSADWGAIGRLEVKAFGNWKDYDFSTGAYGSTSDFLVFGVANDYTEAGDTHAFTYVADVDYGTRSGFALYGAFTGRAFAHSTIASIGSTGGTTGKATGTNGNDWSFRGQASYAIDRHWEPYAQYEFLHLDPNNLPAHAQNQIQILRAGINYYIFGPVARISVEAEYLPGGSPLSDDGSGILATGGATKTSGITHGGGNEFIGRVQFQIAL